MKSRCSVRLLCSSTAMAGFLLGAAPASAQEPEAAGANIGVEDIIVTAQKIRQSANDVGMSITALAGDTLAKVGITNPEQLTKVVPGLNITPSGNGSPVYTLRGVGFYDVVAGAPPAVSLYVDEVPLPFPIMARGAALDVQRLEVLKGPQGTLFGQNSTGGAINFIANRPTDEFKYGVDLTYGSYSRLTTTGFVSGPISETLKFRVAGSVDSGGGWQRSVTRDDTTGDARVYLGRVLLDWTPTSAIKVQWNANGWIDRSDEQAGQLVAISNPGNPTAAAALAAYPKLTSSRQADWDEGLTLGYIDPSSGHTHYKGFRRDSSFYQLAQRVDVDLSPEVKLTSITAYNKLNQDDFIDNDGTNQQLFNVVSVTKIDSLTQELRLSGKNGPLTWVVGGNYGHDKIDSINTTFISKGSAPILAGSAFSTERIETLAAFAHVDYAITDAVNVIAGVRYTDVLLKNVACTHDVYGDLSALVSSNFPPGVPPLPQGACVTFDTASNPPTIGNVYGRLHQHNVPLTLGVNWKVAPRALIYANFNRGYKAGTFSPTGASDSIGYDPAVQERVLAYETGFKLGLADNHVQFNGAAFYYDYKDKQVRGSIYSNFFQSPVTKLVNIPKSRIYGAELQLTVVPDDHWHIGAGGTYVNSKILGSFFDFPASGASQKEMGGETLPLTPRWQAQADVEYKASLSNTVDGFVGGRVQYQDGTYGGLGEETEFRIAPYATADLQIGARAANGKWSVTAFVNNVTDKYSWSAVNHNGLDPVTRLANPPRLFGLRLTVKN